MLSRFSTLFFAAFNIVIYAQLAFGQETPSSPISIRIDATEPSPKQGEPIEIRIELTNRAGNDLLVGRNLTGTGANPGDITFEVKNSAGVAEPSNRAAVDCLTKPNPDSLMTAVMKRWIALPPGSSFVTNVKLGPSSFLQQPGRYKISATYESRGVGEQSWTDCVHATPEEIAKLPFSAWEGKVESNAIWIRVKSARKKPSV